jgi:hypothetical protein
VTVVVPPGFWEFIQYVTEIAEQADELGVQVDRFRRQRSPRARTLRIPEPKRRRKVSAYQKEFGRQLKKLKKKHPRTPTSKLMKRAHAATKRARRGKR